MSELFHNIKDISLGGKEVACIKAPILPQEYQQVEYLESHGTEWIDTGVVINNDNYVVAGKIQAKDVPYSSWNGIFGSYINENTNTTRVINNSGTGGNPPQVWAYCNTKAGGGWTRFEADINSLLEFRLSSNEMTINNVTNPASVHKGAINTDSLIICGYNKNNSSNRSKNKIYYFTIQNGLTTIRNLIPCYRKSDHKPGLYDLANSRKNLFCYVDNKGYVKPLATYSMRFNFIEAKRLNVDACNSNGEIIQTLFTLSSDEPLVLYSFTFVAPANTAYVKFNYTTRVSDVMLVEGSDVPSEYEPYPFYVNQGTGEFSVGDDIPMYDPDTLEVFKDYPDGQKVWEKEEEG